MLASLITRKNPIPTAPLPEKRPSAVQQVAQNCFTELAISLCFCGAIAPFIATPAAISAMAAAILAQTAVSIVFHSIKALSSSDYVQWTSQKITSYNFAFFTAMPVQTLIHEFGHALAALSVYKNPRPTVQIAPFMGGGITDYYKTALSAFGKKLGPYGSTLLVAASGPGLALLVSSILLSLGLYLKESFPNLSNYLISWAVIDYAYHALYALSALGVNQSSRFAHDFVRLSILGIHPLAACTAIVAIPILIIASSQTALPTK